ncbi:hypothetical protein [Nonomuraea sp. NPDC050202]|uniref:hypothetical protein n=1 Tax=Nonomuraea sp. NPDC050202 TaxID=3155035 RepID=UPI0033FA9E75
MEHFDAPPFLPIITNDDTIETRDALALERIDAGFDNEEIVASLLREKEAFGFTWNITVEDVEALRNSAGS